MKKPPWLGQALDLCRHSGISVVGWGPDILVIKAGSSDNAAEITNQLAQLGLKVVEDEDDESAGLLSFSRNPATVQVGSRQQIASIDISRRRWPERLEPLIFLIGAPLLASGRSGDDGHSLSLAHFLGLICIVAFFWDGARIWGWRLEHLPAGLRVRRYFRWTIFPWVQIRGIEAIPGGRGQESLVLKLASGKSERLGKFDSLYARNARDTLRQELARRTAATAS
jgi:hypothetical protein